VKTVTIAIPSLHRPDLTARCLECIQQQTLPADSWEVVVIENEARPESILPDPLPPHTQRIELANNEGTTGSINRAVAATESRYILLLNNDVELQPDYIERLVRTLDSDPKLGFATGKLLRATQRTDLDGAGDAMLVGGGGYRLGNFDPDRGQFDRPVEILSACGAAVLYRRDVFEACGRLDENFFAYLDDLDLALRTQLLGLAGMYAPEAVAYHVGSATLGNALHPKIVEYLTRNQIYILLKDYPRRVLVRLLPQIFVYQSLWLLYALRNRALGSYLRGWLAAIRHWGDMQRKHAELMMKRRISDEDFRARLRESELQVYQWQQSRGSKARSWLLNFYFGIFGRR
jgi:GT2 family glycosyltransferase